jgi:hypothetical protein
MPLVCRPAREQDLTLMRSLSRTLTLGRERNSETVLPFRAGFCGSSDGWAGVIDTGRMLEVGCIRIHLAIESAASRRRN